MTVKDLIVRNSDLDEDYVLSLGASVYYFSSAEWMAVACCENMQTGYTRIVVDDPKTTARNVAQKLIKLTKELDESQDKKNLLAAATEFERLVIDERNVLLHAYPASVDGRALLHNAKDQKSFSIEALEDFLNVHLTVATV